MVCTLTIHQKSMMNGQNKSKELEKPTKRAAKSVQGIVETQREITKM